VSSRQPTIACIEVHRTARAGRHSPAPSDHSTFTIAATLPIVAVIPEPRDQQGHRKRRGCRGGRPVTYDRDRYKGRNVVERSFNALKHWRALATRYDKLAIVYRGGAVLAAILTWLRTPLGDTS